MRVNSKFSCYTAVFLSALFLSGCSSSPTPLSTTQASSVSSFSTTSELESSLSLSQSIPESIPAETPSTQYLNTPQALELQDFLVCIDGRAVLSPADVTFWVFSFAGNAEINRLNQDEISTIRELSLGDDTQTLGLLYQGIPVEIYENTQEEGSIPYEDYHTYLQSDAPTASHHAVYSLYLVDDEVVYEPYRVQQALEANRYGQIHTIVRYDLDVNVEAGLVADILFSVNDMTPFPSTHLAGQQFVQEGQYTVGVYSLNVGNTGLVLPLGIQNLLDEPVRVLCNYTVINGQATRNPGYFEIHLPAGGYGEQVLLILNEDIHPTGVETLESIGILLQFYADDGELLFESEGIEVSVYSNLAP